MVKKEREGTKYPQSGVTGENTRFAKRNKENGVGQGSQQFLTYWKQETENIQPFIYHVRYEHQKL